MKLLLSRHNGGNPFGAFPLKSSLFNFTASLRSAMAGNKA